MTLADFVELAALVFIAWLMCSALARVIYPNSSDRDERQ